MALVEKVIIEGEGNRPWYDLERKIEKEVRKRTDGCKGCEKAMRLAKGTSLGAKSMALYFDGPHLVGWEVIEWVQKPWEAEGYYSYPRR